MQDRHPIVNSIAFSLPLTALLSDTETLKVHVYLKWKWEMR